MLAHVCLVPHSPLLLPNVSGLNSAFPNTRSAFTKIALQMQAQGIKTIISLAAHARYERDGFSLTIAPSLSVDFSPFGDLTNRLDLRPHWPLYHQLREIGIANALPMHPLDDERLDYGHGVPLWLLQSAWPRLDGCRLLTINDHDSMTPQQREVLGFLLSDMLKNHSEPVAVICSGDLHTVRAEALPWDTVKEQNELLRVSILDSLKADKVITDTTCLTGPTTVLRGLCKKENIHLVEQSFEHADPTSFLCLSWSKPTN